jgi:hypothetical protein
MFGVSLPTALPINLIPAARQGRLLLFTLIVPLIILPLYLYHSFSSSPLNISLTLSPTPVLNTSWHALIHVEEHAAGKPYASITESVETPSRKKVALLIETRPIPYLVPLLLHFLSVVPPDWSFRFMGSPASHDAVLTSPAIQRAIAAKKLNLDSIPEQHSVGSRSALTHLFVDPWFYETWLYPAEWLFVFQSDSMVCSASNMTLNDFVAQGYPFLGAGKSTTNEPNAELNGGISLRHVPSLLSVLRTQPRPDGYFSEDRYFSTGLWSLNNTQCATGKAALRFAVEMVWDDEGGMPFAFHPYVAGSLFRGPGGPQEGHWHENMDRAHRYCPELGLITVSRFECDCKVRPDSLYGIGN